MVWISKIQIRWFDVWGGQFIHSDVRPSKFGFSSTKGTEKIHHFLYFNLCKND